MNKSLDTTTKKDPVTVQPTTYLIGTNGSALEVIAGAVSSDELIVKMSHAIEKHTTPLKTSTEMASGGEKASTSSAEADAATSAAAEDAKSLEEKVAM